LPKPEILVCFINFVSLDEPAANNVYRVYLK